MVIVVVKGPGRWLASGPATAMAFLALSLLVVAVASSPMVLRDAQHDALLDLHRSTAGKKPMATAPSLTRILWCVGEGWKRSDNWGTAADFCTW